MVLPVEFRAIAGSNQSARSFKTGASGGHFVGEPKHTLTIAVLQIPRSDCAQFNSEVWNAVAAVEHTGGFPDCSTFAA